MPAKRSNTRRASTRRANRVSPVSALALEVVALVGIVAIAQPELVLPYLKQSATSAPSQPQPASVAQEIAPESSPQASLLPPIALHPVTDPQRSYGAVNSGHINTGAGNSGASNTGPISTALSNSWLSNVEPSHLGHNPEPSGWKQRRY